MSKAGGRGAPKPLKGSSINSNSGVFETLSANNLKISSVTIEALVSGSQFDQVTILNSEILNTIIGVNGPNQAYFTTLNTNNDVLFSSQNASENVYWDSANGIFNVNSEFNLNGTLDINCGKISNVSTLTGCSSSGLNIISSITRVTTSNFILSNNSKLNLYDTTNSVFADSSGNISVVSFIGDISLITNTSGNSSVKISNNTQLQIGSNNSFISSDSSGNLLLNNSVGDISLITNTSGNSSVKISNNTQLQIGSNNSISSDSSGNLLLNNSVGDISLITNTSGNSSVKISSNTQLQIGSTNSSISSDSSGNLLLNNSVGDISLITNTIGNSSVKISSNTQLQIGSSNNSISSDSFGNLLLNNSGNILLNTQNNSTNGNVILNSSSNLVFGDYGTRINGDGTNLNIFGYNVGINSSIVTISGDVNIIGSLTALNTYIASDVFIFPVGTSLLANIDDISNTSPTSSNVLITTSTPTYLTIGDQVTLKNTNSDPVIDGTYIVTGVVDNFKFIIFHSILISPGTYGILTSNLTSDPKKDIGLQFDYYSNNNGITAGSVNYKTGYLGYSHDLQRLVYYKEALISNNLVTSGTLGNFQVNELIPNSISGFTLLGNLVGESGAQINNTPIGQITPQTGTFTNIYSTVSSNLSNVTLNNNLNYSIDRYTLSSLLPTRNPSLNSVISFVTVSGNTFIGSGTMGTTSINDGQLKKIIVSSMGNNCEYRLQFPVGTLIAPNPRGGSANTIVLRRKGQSFEMAWDTSLNAWILLTSGAYVM